jgi:trigger factor
MSAKITKRTDTEVTFLITATSDEINHAREHSFEHLRGRVKAAGFRPGKAPDNIVERELGSQTVQAEVLDHALQHAYADAVQAQEDITVIATPEISIKKFVPYTELEFEAKVEIMPPVKLADYKKIKKSPPAVKIDESKIAETIEDLRRRLAKRTPVSRSAETGDEVKFDFDGKREGQPVPGASAKNHVLKLGSQQFIPGFEEELVGLKPGDSKTFNITFPKDYHEKELAGHPVEFSVAMREVTELSLPEVDDKLAAEIGPFKTVAELRTDIADQLRVEAAEASKNAYENELLEEIVKKSQVAAPQRLVAQQLERLKVEFSQRLAASGLDIDKYLQLQNKTQEDLESELKPEAEKRVKLAIVLSEVAKAEGLTVSVAEIDAELENLRKRYTDPAMQQELAGERIREDIYNHLLAGRTVAKLVEYAQSK